MLHGEERFKNLLKLLPKNTPILGLDENTAIIFDFKRNIFTIEGKGTATLLIGKNSIIFSPKETYLFSSIKKLEKELTDFDFFRIKKKKEKEISFIPIEDLSNNLKKAFFEREYAKKIKDFNKSDLLRKFFEDSGFCIQDTPKGQKIFKK